MTRKSVPFTTPYSVKHDTKYVWVKSFEPLPVRPDQRTFSAPVGMSQNGMDRPCSRPEPLRE